MASPSIAPPPMFGAMAQDQSGILGDILHFHCTRFGAILLEALRIQDDTMNYVANRTRNVLAIALAIAIGDNAKKLIQITPKK
jgi:hypothetical protein